MTNNTLHISGTKSGTARTRGVGKSKIPREEWPRIRARREAGETMSAISRDYGVTPPAISYIVKHTSPSDDVIPAEEIEPSGPDITESAGDAGDDAQAPETSDAAGPGDAAAAGAPASEAADRREAGEETPPPMAAAQLENALAQRLNEAAWHCCQVVEAAAAQGVISDPEALGEAIHNVRRALVAIEIDMSKRERKRKPAQATTLAEENAESGRDEQVAAAANDDGSSFASGTVKFYRADKGFGFVTPDDGSGDVYVPSKVLDALGIDRLHKGQRVKLRRRQGAKGPEVEDLRVLAS